MATHGSGDSALECCQSEALLVSFTSLGTRFGHSPSNLNCENPFFIPGVCGCTQSILAAINWY